jgi:outer membrane protein assembly factor BamB
MLTTRQALLGAVLLVVLLAACGPVHVDPRWSSIRQLPEGNVRLDDQGNPRQWDARATDNQQTRFYSNPILLDDDTLLVASWDKRMVEVDIPGARVEPGGAVLDQHIAAPPTLDENMVYVGLADHDLVGMQRDGATLTPIWRIPTRYGVWAQPVVEGEIVYFTSMDHNLYAADKTSGEVLWTANLEGASTSQPLVADGVIYVGSFAKKVIAFAADSGEKLAEFGTNDWVWSQPALVDDTLYVSDMSGMVYALAADGLEQVWQTQVSNRSIAQTPLVTDEYVIVGSRDHNVYWLNRPDGTVANTRQVAGEVLSDILLIEPSEQVNIPEPLVVVSTSALQELLVAFTLDNGERQWVYGR